MLFWRSKPVTSKEFDQLSELMQKLDTKVKELSHAVTMLEIDLHNTRDKILKKIKPKDLDLSGEEVKEKKEGIFLRPDGSPINI
jgi:DNA-binding protein